jgi:polyprenyl synthetase
MAGDHHVDGTIADIAPSHISSDRDAPGNGRPRSPNGRLHSKNLALTIPERITLEEVRKDPGYDPSIEQYLKDVDRHLVPYMRDAVGLIPEVETLRAGVAAQIHTGGKRIRAALCVVCCELFGADYMRALPYAAAIEHIQNLTLIHDDIADGDTERRSRPAMWKQYGVPHAINIGDAFIPLGSLSKAPSLPTSRSASSRFRTPTTIPSVARALSRSWKSRASRPS